MSAWIQGVSGVKLEPFNMSRASVNLEDIAHALSHICRFNGHCDSFYSVAEHSVRVSYEVPREHALAALFHDAAVYVLGDIVRPLKGSVAVYIDEREEFVPIRVIEDAAHAVICSAFGISPEVDACVHEADLRMVLTEARDLLAPPPEPWDISAEPYRATISPWAADVAKLRFLLRYREITEGEA